MKNDNCWNCKNNVLANGNCSDTSICDKYIRDNEDIEMVDKLLRYMRKDYYIDKIEAEQVMCEMVDIFKTYNINEDYTFLLNDCTYDCYAGFAIGKLNIKDWDKEAHDYGLNILIESDAWYMFNFDEETFHEEQDFEGNMERSREFIQCMAKLRRLFRRHELEYEFRNYGYLLSFRKVKVLESII